ncbi:MFS transporter, partial [Patulibacter sp.]|uniref:MFS transporter n=1 Tax=Patulibacter sp. TaxID=1912859 RepID=UPI00271F6DD4
MSDPPDVGAGAPGVRGTALVLGAMLVPVSLGITAISVATGPLAADLGLTDAEAVWVLAGYVLAHAISLATLGRLGDTHGLAVVLRITVVLLAVGSVLAATSGSLPALVAGRVVQGLGAGGMPVVVFGVVGLRFRRPQQVAVLATVTAMLGIVSGAGSLVGGALSDLAGWRAVVALPVLSVLPAALVLRTLPPPAAVGQRVDLVGAAVVAIWASALVLLLESPSVDLATTTLVLLVAVVAATSGLLVHRIRTRPDGFVPAAVVGSRRFVLGALAAATTYCAYVALLFAAPLMLLRDHDWSTTTVGLVLLPAAAVGAVAARVVGRLIRTRDPFRVAAVLAGSSAAGMLVAGVADGAPVPTTIGLSLVLTGFIASQGGLVAHVPLALPAELRSVATGIFQLAALVGGALGSAVVAGLSSPIGLGAAVACIAVVPAVGVGLALAAGAVGGP